ncbi:hypothetical protein [Hankyongella ginsenosidimutans]|nr:hypothetical protein [Hankyongella ginsenosidimutans]
MPGQDQARALGRLSENRRGQAGQRRGEKAREGDTAGIGKK